MAMTKIMVHGENHGNHGDCEFVIFLQPYISVQCSTGDRAVKW